MAESISKKTESERDQKQSESETIEKTPSETSKRLVSLDAFRGLTILGMLLVNNVMVGTASPRHLKHAEWNRGMHLADMVFPWFLFIVGVAIPYSAASFRRQGFSVWRYDLKALQRAVTLILLGLLLNSSIARTPTFGLGVLQLIGFAYFLSVLLYPMRTGWRIITAGLLLTAHWAAIRFVPVPGIGAGNFEENANLINYLNTVYLSHYHLQGLVSVVPTAALVLIGTVFGDTLESDIFQNRHKVIRLVAGGVIIAAIGWLWNLDQPFSKPLWTASYILFSAGLGAITLGIFYLVIDLRGFRQWSYPLVVFGANAILAYVAPILVKMFILLGWTWESPPVTLQQAFLTYLTGRFGQVAGGWTYTAIYIVFWWIVLFQLYRKKILLRV